MTACNTDEIDPFWQGTWVRTVTVPKDVSGRCYEERLVLEGKRWFLHAVLHATDSCSNPYLELSYQGVLDEIQIQRNSADKKLTMQIENIELISMVDVAGSHRQVVPQGAIAAISKKYVPEEFQIFSQYVEFSDDNQQMHADYFNPLLTLAIPSIKDLRNEIAYQRYSSK